MAKLSKLDSFDAVLNEKQNVTVYGDYSPYEAGNYGITDTSYPCQYASFDIVCVIWHKEWNGNIIDIDVTDILNDNDLLELEENYIQTKM